MNQFFSFKRYLWLVKRQWFENAAIYKWGIVLMVLTVGFLFGMTSNWKTADNPQLGQKQVFFITVILFFYIYAAYFFESLSSKHKRMFYFSLPVLPLERIAVAFTFVMLLMPALFLTVFTIFDFITVQLFNYIHGTSAQMFFKTDFSGIMGISLFWMFLGYFSFISIFTLGSLIFGKKGPVISLIFIFAFIFIYFWIWRWLITIGVCSPKPDFIVGNGRDIFVYLIPVWWVLMYFVMKRKEA